MKAIAVIGRFTHPIIREPQCFRSAMCAGHLVDRRSHVRFDPKAGRCTRLFPGAEHEDGYMRIFPSDAARLRYSMVFEYCDGHAPAARG